VKKFLVAAAMLLSSAVAANAVTPVEDFYVKDYIHAVAAENLNDFCYFEQRPLRLAKDAIELGEQILVKYPNMKARIQKKIDQRIQDMMSAVHVDKRGDYCAAHKKEFYKHLNELKSSSDEDVGEAVDN
jgi:precorrin isomerase